MAALRPVVGLRHPRSGFQPRPGVGRARGAEGGMAMNLTQWQTKPSWGEYEAQLLKRSFEPYWDPETEQRITTAGITCCRCGGIPAYIGMTDGNTELGFLACTPECGEWIWFLAPLPPAPLDGEGDGR